MQPVFDGHNDVLLRLWTNAAKGADPVAEFMEGTSQGHIDMPRAQKGGLAGGLCAIYISSGDFGDETRDANGHYAMPLSEPLERAPSLDIALDMASIAFRIDRAGGWKICRDSGGHRAPPRPKASLPPSCTWKAARRSTPISPRSTSSTPPACARSARCGAATTSSAMACPSPSRSSPDTGPGLTDAGKRLVRECNRIGIADRPRPHHRKGFLGRRQALGPAADRQPLECPRADPDQPQPDRQAARRGAREQRPRRPELRRHHAARRRRARRADTPLSDMIRHIDHLVERMSASTAWRSARTSTAPPFRPRSAMPQASRTSLPRCATLAMVTPTLAKICRDNWLRVLARRLARDRDAK